MAASELYLTYLNRPDVEALALTDDEILDAVEGGLRAQGLGQTVIEPRVHLRPDEAFRGHFNVLRGYIAPLGLAGVKVVGDYVDNYQRSLPSENGLLTLYDPRTGVPQAVIDAAGLTDMRTGAVTALGARRLARPGSRVLGHIGARGTAYWNVRLLAHLFELDEIRCIPGGPRAARPSARSSSATSAVPCACAKTGSPSCAEPTSWSRLHASSGPSPCCARNGSRRARWSCPTAR